ncbi:BMP family lipoprotein [Brevibacillus laterosporus]|uniref:BMP family lipoprotein n=1 Tax=Brevibacillus laterosporus TaxID=1465 RepID=UPI0018CF1352|nr:BMP family ABC transporter substrate-binding protein [Brevibacillus laterosporus]MBG9790022.1 CD4+ T-cell-stimulating antigen [Brevibacillus laterosporus]
MKKMISRALPLLLVLPLALSGCGKQQPTTPAGDVKSDVKIGMVTSVGTVNDNSFNQGTWEGLQKVNKDKGAEVQYLQSSSDADIIPNLNQFVKEKWDLTFGIGFPIMEHVQRVAKENPEAKLAVIDTVVEAPNVTSVVFKEEEGSFLAGVVAALTSKTKKVGFVGGIEIPVTKRFEKGFLAGVKAADPTVEVNAIYTGAFDKPDAGKSAASSLYNQGADILYHAAGASGDGVFNEAKARKGKGENVWVIGVDMDQSLVFGDDVTLTSMMKRVDEAAYLVATNYMTGKFEGGKTLSLGLKENGVGLSESSRKNISEDVWKKVEEFRNKIISGEIKIQ